MEKRSILKFSPETAQYLDGVIARNGYSTQKEEMLGNEVHSLNGHVFCGATEKGIFVHLGIEAAEDALASNSGTAPFEPLEGEVMKDYLLLLPPEASFPDNLKKWLDKAGEYLLSLPPKT